MAQRLALWEVLKLVLWVVTNVPAALKSETTLKISTHFNVCALMYIF